MRKTGTLLVTAAVCAAMFAGCGASTTESSVSTTSSTSSSSESTSEESSTSTTSLIYSSDPSYEYLTGDYSWEDCLTLPTYKGLELTKEVEKVDADDIEDYYKTNMEAETVTDSDATVEDGDYVKVDYECKFEGDSEYGDPSGTDYEVTVGSGSNIDGFEEGLIGLKVGEEAYLDLQFPDDYWSEDYAGKAVTFHVTLKSISRTPEVTDEWVSEFTDGEYSTKADYDVYVKQTLEETAQSNAKSSLRQSAWQEVYNNTEYKALPEEYVNEGMDYLEQQMLSNAQLAGYDTIEEYLEQSGNSQEEYDGYKRYYGESYAKTKILVDAIWDTEEMTTDHELYQEALSELADSMGVASDELISNYGEDNVADYCRSMAVNDIIVSYANVTETESDS